MLSSLYIHIALLIASSLFLLSFLDLLIRLEVHFNTSQSKRTLDQSPATLLPIRYATQNFESSTNKEINEISLRQKVLDKNTSKHSIFNRFKFINPVKPFCANLQDPNNSIIFIVLSRALNFDYRQAIRTTWGRSENYKPNNISVKTIFFIGIDDSVDSAIRDEQAMFNDIVEINIPENLPFTVYKELAALFWLRLYCPLVRLLFRIDDDILLDIFLLLHHIEHDINLKHQDGINGWFRLNSTVLRSGRSAVTTREYQSNTYPPYTLSTGYLFSNESCQRFVDAANHPEHNIIRIGDVYITGILRDFAKIPYYTYSSLESILVYYNEMSCSSHFERRPRLLVCTSQLHINIRGNTKEYYDVWNGLLTKHNKTLLTL